MITIVLWCWNRRSLIHYSSIQSGILIVLISKAFLILYRCLGIWSIVSNNSFCNTSVFFIGSIFPISIWNINRLSTEVLSMHCLDSCIWAFEVIITNETVPFRSTCFGISHNLGWQHNSKWTKNISKHFFIYIFM